MKVRGDKWVKWGQEAVLVSHQKDQEEIQESEDRKVLEDRRVSVVNQEKGEFFALELISTLRDDCTNYTSGLCK